MKTAHKIALAKAVYTGVHAARSVAGMRDQCVVRRKGIRFALDLSEGIDFSIFLLGAFEPSTTAALAGLVKPGSIVFDVGANVGAHTLPLAKLVGEQGKVFAFEPTDFAYRKLSANLVLNPELAQRVKSYQCFLGREDSREVPQRIYSSWPLRGGGDLNETHLGRVENSGGATVRSLDDIWSENGNGKVDIIKMDVDGYECDVLSGARRVIGASRPTFVMELTPYCLEERGASMGELLAFFAEFKYQFYHEKTNARLPTAEQEVIDMIGPASSINVIARPL